MGTIVTSIPPLAAPPAVRAGSFFAPVQADVEEADRIFARTLAPYTLNTGPVGRAVAPLVHHLRHYRGKRLRPALLLLAAKACGGVRPAHHVPAAAVEMIHTATLVHDDVLDEAAVRRHVDTVNAGWGNKAAILLGDMLFTHAFHLTSTVDGRACQVIGAATNQVCTGELHQTRERGNLELDEASYFEIIGGKTAALTECCGVLGAAYAGSPDATTAALGAYGRNIGLAFQVSDDLIDLLGDPQKAGKTLGTDLAQRKLTLPLIHCLGRLPGGEAAALRRAIDEGGPGLGDRVLGAMAGTDSLAYARRRAEEFSRAARQSLAVLPPSECRNVLDALADWSTRRES